MQNQRSIAPIMTRQPYIVNNSRPSQAHRPYWFNSTKRVLKEKSNGMFNDKSFPRRRQSYVSLSSNGAKSRVFDSFLMEKCSYDPKQDFKESMVEMILEKELHQDSYDLMELLQCYLSLNSQKFHNIIIRAYAEVWVDILIHQPYSR